MHDIIKTTQQNCAILLIAAFSTGCKSHQKLEESAVNQRFGSVENALRLADRPHDYYCDLKSEYAGQPVVERFGFTTEEDWLAGKSQMGRNTISLHELPSYKKRAVVEKAYFVDSYKDSSGKVVEKKRHALKLTFLTDGPTAWVGIENIHVCDQKRCFEGDNPRKYVKIAPHTLRNVSPNQKCASYR